MSLISTLMGKADESLSLDDFQKIKIKIEIYDKK
jgi:hypothetical protein